jgi:hypothetical protein
MQPQKPVANCGFMGDYIIASSSCCAICSQVVVGPSALAIAAGLLDSEPLDASGTFRIAT